jgi:putative phosphoesterase
LRIAVAGDTHGKIEKLTSAMRMLKPDYLFFTGDFYADGLKLARQLSIKWTGVTGNCDFGQKGKQEQQINCRGRRFYLIHGHQYGVKRSINSLFYRGQEVGADVVIFGHTHIPMCEQIDGMWMINPGSASLPRLGSPGSYALINLTEEEMDIQIIEI